MKLLNLKKVIFAVTLLIIASCSNDENLSLSEDNSLTIKDGKEISTNTSSKSSNSIELSISNGTASTAHSSYPASKAIDKNTSSANRWSGYGTGVTYLVDLGTSDLVDYLKIYWRGSRNYSFKVHTSNSSSGSWTLVGTKTSTGSGDFEEFDVVNSTARYVRLTCNGNNVSLWNNITELEIWGTGGNNSGGSASDILGGLTNWKLNAYSGTLNTSSSDNDLNYVDNASKSDNSNWLYASNGWAYFKTYPGNPTSSSGTSNPRTELREMVSNGSTEIHWDGTTSTEHSMKWTVRVDDLPPSGKVCFGQIHAESGSSYDDVVRIQVQGNSGQNSGGVTLRINGYVTEDLLGAGVSIDNFTFNMDTSYSFELTMQNKIVKLYALNSSGSRSSTLFTSGSVNSDANYFKAGCYLQSTSSNDSGSSVYGLVGINYLSVSH